MTTLDHDAADRLDDYLDRLAQGDGQPLAALSPWLAATARAVRTHHEAPAPDPRFVARLRETLLMDASIPLPRPNVSPNPALNGSASIRATSLPPLSLSALDRRHRDARRHLATSVAPSPVPTAIGSRRAHRSPAQRWNRLGWPIVELIGAAALIIGLVSVLMGGNGGGSLPALIPGFGQTTEVATLTTVAGEVAMAQGNAGRTGDMPGPGVMSDPTLSWRLPLDAPLGTYTFPPPIGGESAVLAAGNSLLYIDRESTRSPFGGPALADVTLHVVDAITGAQRWTTTFSGVSQGQPAIAEGLVIVAVDPLDGILAPQGGTPDPEAQYDRTRGYVIAFDVSSGAERWRTAAGLVGYQSPAYADGLVYLMDRDGEAFGLDIRTGERKWSSPNVPPSFTIAFGPLDPVGTSVAVSGGMLVVTSFSGFTYAFRIDDGSFAWSWPAEEDLGINGYGSGFQTRSLNPVISGETVFLSGTTRDARHAIFAAVDLVTGEERWTRQEPGSDPIPVAVADDVAVLLTGPYDGSLLQAVDVASGQSVLWERSVGAQEIGGLADTAPSIWQGVLYVGQSDGTITALDLQTGSDRWQVRTGGAISGSIVVASDHVYAASEDDWLYAIGDSGAPDTDQTVLDVSGLPTCDVKPRPAVQATPIPNNSIDLPSVALPEATPVATLPNLFVGEDAIQPPVIAWDAIPDGRAPDQQQVDGIADTLAKVQACSRPGNERYVAAFYSNDYFLRSWVVWQLAYSGYSVWSTVGGDLDRAELLASARVLPDGRIAVVQTDETNLDIGNLVVFTEIDGQWLIDEWVSISPDGRPTQG